MVKDDKKSVKEEIHELQKHPKIKLEPVKVPTSSTSSSTSTADIANIRSFIYSDGKIHAGKYTFSWFNVNVLCDYISETDRSGWCREYYDWSLAFQEIFKGKDPRDGAYLFNIWVHHYFCSALISNELGYVTVFVTVAIYATFYVNFNAFCIFYFFLCILYHINTFKNWMAADFKIRPSKKNQGFRCCASDEEILDALETNWGISPIEGPTFFNNTSNVKTETDDSTPAPPKQESEKFTPIPGIHTQKEIFKVFIKFSLAGEYHAFHDASDAVMYGAVHLSPNYIKVGQGATAAIKMMRCSYKSVLPDGTNVEKEIIALRHVVNELLEIRRRRKEKVFEIVGLGCNVRLSTLGLDDGLFICDEEKSDVVSVESVEELEPLELRVLDIADALYEVRAYVKENGIELEGEEPNFWVEIPKCVDSDDEEGAVKRVKVRNVKMKKEEEDGRVGKGKRRVSNSRTSADVVVKKEKSPQVNQKQQLGKGTKRSSSSREPADVVVKKEKSPPANKKQQNNKERPVKELRRVKNEAEHEEEGSANGCIFALFKNEAVKWTDEKMEKMKVMEDGICGFLGMEGECGQDYDDSSGASPGISYSLVGDANGRKRKSGDDVEEDLKDLGMSGDGEFEGFVSSGRNDRKRMRVKVGEMMVKVEIEP
ncbi:hypothetical protein HDU76_002922 [Blyttiomyces sp. JEL0837]|nr:hypothetical protein HDU76_002922 [Blyttiomyces sp. JEL0837]